MDWTPEKEERYQRKKATRLRLMKKAEMYRKSQSLCYDADRYDEGDYWGDCAFQLETLLRMKNL